MAGRLRKAIIPTLLSSGVVALGYFIQSCVSQLEKDVEKWEKVLQRTTMMDRGCGQVLCRDGWRELDWLKLLRGD